MILKSINPATGKVIGVYREMSADEQRRQILHLNEEYESKIRGFTNRGK